MKQSKTDDLKKADFEVLSRFRVQMRRFERFSENAAHAEGIPPLQYLLLLHIKGFPGREWANIRELAECLQAKPHGVVALVTRCEEAQLVKRVPSATDRRQIEVHLLARGEEVLHRLAALHRAELASLDDGAFSIPFIKPQN
ncbi:MAG TPA: MarR family transcriptional regulator [Oxalobacteraceae bacterium]|jgi:DNA-binding MarR family transcriptional regulator|nr:MarR family transcriptional regulator [Oxalobacteraceae bacterium]HCN91117.1 MarR family transcriptional regulator [Oxalobacteraceae bacterium]